MYNNILKYKKFVELIKEDLQYISKESLPEFLYHVSPFSKEIQNSGVLKAQSFGGGFGGGHTKGVSFFKDINQAENYKLGMILAIDLSKCENKEEALIVFGDWLKIQENRIGKDLSNLLNIFKSEWERRENLKEPVMDTIESVRKVIHMIGARNYSDRRLDDPIIIGGMERLKKLNSENVKIITVKTQDINSGIIFGTDTDEIRVLGDVIIYKINESLRDKMIPKSDEDIWNSLKDLSRKEILEQSLENNYLSGIKYIVENKLVQYEFKLILNSLFNLNKDIIDYLINNKLIRKNIGKNDIYLIEKYIFDLHQNEEKDYEKWYKEHLQDLETYECKPNKIFYVKNGTCLYYYDKNYNFFSINYKKIWMILENKYNLSNNQIKIMTKHITKKELNIKIDVTIGSDNVSSYMSEICI
jgi:hypothetical protein